MYQILFEMGEYLGGGGYIVCPYYQVEGKRKNMSILEEISIFSAMKNI